MIIKETVEIKGKQYDYTHSDSGVYIKRDGNLYDGAFDPLNSDRIYTETSIPLDCDLSESSLYRTSYNIVTGQEVQA